MLLGVLARVLYTLNVKLPKLPKINVEREPAPAPEKKQAKTPYVTKETQTTSDLLKIAEQATWKKTAVAWAGANVWTSTSGSLLKDGFGSLFKQKLEQKIAEKEQAKPRPPIHFSWDKPTFPVSLLASNLSEAQQIDEKAIVEKA